MSKRAYALMAAWTVALIYGVTFTIAKDVMPKYIDAFGFIFLRVGGSTLLFWLAALFVKTEKIDKKRLSAYSCRSFLWRGFQYADVF
jgi:drug/metabolite transporter (DMT)-like permease